MLPLSGDQICVYYAFPESFDGEAQVAALTELLDDDERARCQRFRFERDQHIFRVAHALSRSVLASLTGLRAAELRFEVGEHGKPELLTTGQAEGLRFNLSHTHGLVACAVALAADLGVDVEYRQRRIELEQVARGVFSPLELEGLHAREGQARRERFFELWTLKEAYIKGVGRGLSMPLRKITLDLEGPEPSLDLGTTGLGDGRDWWLALARPAVNHQLAVAVRSRHARSLQLHEWRPDASPT